MRAVWVDSGNDPVWEKVVEHKLTALFFDAFDARMSEKYLKDIVAKQKYAGIYIASNWPQVSGDGRDFAEKVSKRLAVVAPGALGDFPKVQLDIEQHDPRFIVDVFTRWRELRPNQATSWTLEPFQAGWFTDELVKSIIANRIRVVPQLYLGNMVPTAGDRVALELVKRGIPPTMISGFYDAAALPVGWDGWAFTMGRLP